MAFLLPGLADHALAYQAAHHLNLAHGRALLVFRAGQVPCKIGIVLDLQNLVPASESEADRLAWQRTLESDQEIFVHPIFHGRYPGSPYGMARPPGARRSRERPGNHPSTPLDFLGVNYYFTCDSFYSAQGGPLKWVQHQRTLRRPRATQETGWGIYPSGQAAFLARIVETAGDLLICILPSTAV